jgi:hypothetical protein
VLSAAILAATVSASPHNFSVGLGGGVGVSEENHYESLAKFVPIRHARAQYDYRVASVVYVGVTGAYEWITRESRDPSVFLAGGVVALRLGDKIRGGVRVAVGAGYAYDEKWTGTDTPKNAHTVGWFFDTSGELAVRIATGAELFLDLSILNWRTFYYPARGPWGKTHWWYATPIAPTLGVRFSW